MRAALLVVSFWSASQAGLAGAQSPAVSDALRKGAYEEAEAAARSALVTLEGPGRRDTLALAHALDAVVAAATANGKAAERATLDFARRALQLKEATRTTSTDRALTLNLLGAIHAQRGEFRTAVALHTRALTAWPAIDAASRPLVADTLDGRARAFLGLERWSDAERDVRRSLSARELDGATEPLALARTLELTARVARELGRYPAAATDLDRALHLWNASAATHPEKAGALEVRGYVAFLLGEINEARQFWAEADALTRTRLQPLHPMRARSARNLAVAEWARGDLRAARELGEQALAIAERSMSPCDPEMAFQLNDLAISLQYDAEYAAAERLLRRELETIRKCHGPAHSSAATAISNQFGLAREVGRYAEAERLGQQAIDIWSRTLGPNHPFVAFGLNNLADFLASRGKWSRAQVLFERALRIRRSQLGPKHPDVAWTLTGLAAVKTMAGKAADARTLIDEAIQVLQAAPLRNPDHLATALTVRGELERRSGEYTQARETLTSALEIRERNLGRQHPLVASTRVDAAVVDFALGRRDAAFGAALDAETDARELLRFTVRYMPEQRALEYATARPKGLDLALSILAAGGAGEVDATRALEAVIRSRGVVLDELAARARTLAEPDPALAALARSAADSRRRFAALILRSTAGQSEGAALRLRVQQQKEDAEAALAEQSGIVRRDLARATAGLDQIRQALPARTALVSFVRYNHARLTPTAGAGTPSYLAFVVRADGGKTVAIALGGAATVEQLVAGWREAAGGQTAGSPFGSARAVQRYRDVAARLRDRVWNPLAPELEGADRVFIVPDGDLQLVNFAALPIGRQSYLIEDGPTIHYLTAERDLLQEPPVRPTGGLLLVGGASYGAAPATTSAQQPAATGCSRSPLIFSDLPGSRAEINAIAALWSSPAAQHSTRGEDVKVLTGSAARKSAVASLAPGRRILHLATHGFFLTDSARSSSSNLRGIGGLTTLTPRHGEFNPLLMSGLALAGANTAGRTARDNGLLTAEEVSALNLQGTEWAVLSACETGVGETTSGEGVLGLRRGFQIAGVRTIILSLWPVEDRSTRDWMAALYRARLLDGENTAQAVRTAGLTVLRNRRASGLSTHPFYWAAFASAGDWR